MHALQPKHTKMKPSEVEEFLSGLNVSLTQIPKIKSSDPALPEGCVKGDVVKIERKSDSGRVSLYYRVVI